MKSSIGVLIVDDERVTRMTIKSLLLKRHATWRVFEAGSKAEADAMLQKETIHCIVLDYMLPDTDGLTLLTEWRNNDLSIPVIMLTGQGDEMLAVKALKSGAYDYLTKNILYNASLNDVLSYSIVNAHLMYQEEKERKRSTLALEMSEERYRGLIENSAMLILRFFPDDQIISFVNDGYCNYFGIDRFEAYGEHFLSFIAKENHEYVQELIQGLTVDNPVETFENHMTIGGAKKWQMWTLQGIFHESGEILEYQLMGEDITGLKMIQLQLSETLEDLRSLKTRQDGDYFLTSLLLEPFNGILSGNENLTVDILVRQKMAFTFKKWNKAIGGDLCYVQDIDLANRRYTVFVNADAMGKSIQGAGGALVLGAVLRALVTRTRFSGSDTQSTPEAWIRSAYLELQKVFETFDGSMMVSMVFGLVDSTTGLIYFINAEHPWTVLMRSEKASFIEKELTLRKLGFDGAEKDFRVQLFQMEPGDIVIMGSDGRDDLHLHGNGQMNEDETLFLRVLEKTGAHLEAIEEELKTYGQLSDDLSLLSMKYTAEIADTSSDDLVLSKAKGLMKEKKRDEAVSFLEKAITLEGAGKKVQRYLLTLLAQKRDYEKARLFVEEYIALAPSDTELIHFASVCFKKNRDYDTAAQLAERTVLRSPGTERYLQNYAECAIETGRFADAREALDRLGILRTDCLRCEELQRRMDTLREK